MPHSSMAMTETAADEPLDILLVEDNDVDVEITRRIVARTGLPLQLEVAHDGEEALQWLERRVEEAGAQLPKFVLLDLGLPTTDGTEVLKRIKSDPRLCAIPVVVLSGMNDEARIERCLELGTNMYFVKPMSDADVVNTVATIQRYWELIDGLTGRGR